MVAQAQRGWAVWVRLYNTWVVLSAARGTRRRESVDRLVEGLGKASWRR